MAVKQQKWLDAQYSVLGSALLQESVVPEIMHRTREDDFQGECATVYRAIRNLFLRGAACDPVSISADLGPGYQQFLMELMDVTPSVSNLGTYIDLCKQQAKMSQLQDIGRQMADADDINLLQKLVDDANGVSAAKSSLKIVTMDAALADFMERHSGKQPDYLSWPIPELNDRIYSEPGDMIVLAGFPSTGKSALALQCAWHWAQKKKVGFFSLETSSQKLFDRQMASAMKLSMGDIKRNSISQQEWEGICAKTGEITSRNLELIPAAGMSAADVRSVTMLRKYDIILVDYLQLLQAPGNNRVEQVTQISIALHVMAQSLGVTVVALSQLARKPKEQASVRLDQLRESGQIEQDADLVLILELAKESDPDGPRRMHIAKNKEGTRPKVLLGFDGKYQTFYKITDPAVMQEFIAAGKKEKRRTPVQNPEPQPDPNQMEILPEDYPVPF